MRLFLKMLFRDIKDAKGQFISILVIIAIGITFYTGLNSTLRNLSSASERYFREYRLAHLWAYFSKTQENVVDRIAKIPGVVKATGRVVQDVKLNPVADNKIIRLITLPDCREATVNDILLKSGRYFTDDSSNQCLVEEAFFKSNALKLGNYLRTVVNGNEFKLKIIGTVKSPEYIYQLRDGSEMFPNHRKFGIAYLKESYGRLLFDFKGSVNEVGILLAEQADVAKVRDQLDRVLENQGLKEIVSREEQLSYDTFSGEIEQLTSIGSVFPMMFLLVAALITYITLSRIVAKQRTLIGTLKALGYSNGRILAHYLTYAMVIGIAGSVLGSVLGQYFSQWMIDLYNTIYQLPLEDFKPQYGLIVPASLLALCFGLLAGFNAAKSELRLVPAESMRPEAPKAGQKTVFERIEALWRCFNFSWKMIVRNLFRYKRRIGFTAVGIILATGLLLTALGMNDSINYMVDQQFSQIQQYDLKVNLDQLLNVNQLSYLQTLTHVVKMEPMVEMSMELRNGWRTKKMGLTVLTRDSKLYRISDRDGKLIRLPKQGILLPERLSRLLNIKVGDQAIFKILWPGKRSEEDQKDILVKRRIAQYVGQSAYGSMEQVNRFFDEGRIANVALLKLDDARHETEVVGKIRELSAVSSVQSKAESIYNLRQALDSVNSMVGIFILAAGALAFAVIYNITNINIHERRRELATLKVLGFTEQEMKQLIFNENFIVTFGGVLAGLPVGGVLLKALMDSAATDNMTLPAVLFYPSYLWAFCLMFGFTILASLVLTRNIRTINMVEALKSSE
jgi:putative ABC transport system permease protein